MENKKAVVYGIDTTMLVSRGICR